MSPRSVYSLPLRRAARWMVRELAETREHLCPDLRLRLITPQVPLYMGRPEDCPFEDPYWAFFWPGGQALGAWAASAEGRDRLAGRRVLDLGCGCGAVGIAALGAGAASLVLNDLDPLALTAAALNLRLNAHRLPEHCPRPTFSSEDLVGPTSSLRGGDLDVLLLGDMFYDDAFASSVKGLLERLCGENGALEVFVGDPGRHALDVLRPALAPVAHFPLPDPVLAQHYGSPTVSVHRYSALR